MARRAVTMNELVEIVYQWHQGGSISAIKRSLGVDRKTIRKYVRCAQQLGLKRGEPFMDEQKLLGGLQGLSQQCVYEKPAQAVLEQYDERIGELLEDQDMTAKQLWRLLGEEGVAVGYSSVKRYVRNRSDQNNPKATVRLEVEPGAEAQVDFGYGRMMYDPVSERKRKAWSFIMTLSFSRHRFVRFVFRMDVATWIESHIRAFEFFGGVPQRIVLDNLKAGVIKPDLYDPTLNRAYADLERHYGFVADPAKVATPKHKGKVERVVGVVRQQVLAGREFASIEEANERAVRWCRQEVGQQEHGTTKRKPYPTFLEEEKPKLTPLPEQPFEQPLWKQCTVHPDHHVVFDRSYYSVPTRYLGKTVWVKGTRKLVEIFHEHALIKTHCRAQRPGQWQTDQQDYPAQKLAYLMATPTYCRSQAAQYGDCTARYVEAILGDHAMRNLRKAQAVLRLGKKYGTEALEQGCERALQFGNYRLASLRTILEKELTAAEPLPAPVRLSALGESFLRAKSYFAGEEPS